MKINAAPRAPGFLHALAYADDTDELVSVVAPTVADAVHRTGAQVALAVSPEADEALRDALADSAGGAGVGRLTTLTRSARESGQTVAAWRARELRALSSPERPVFVVAQHDPDLDGADGGFWTELEAGLNIALDGLPVTQVCVYPRLPLHGVVGEAAPANHPLLLRTGELRRNPVHRSPADVLAALPPGRPVVLRPPDLHLTYNTFELGRVRAAVADAADTSEFDRVRGEDMVQAVNEIATNAVEHGSAEAGLSVWAQPGELVCEVHDRGALRHPLVGLAPPHPAQPRGRGTWVARQLCDSLHVWADADGTHVRLVVRG